MIAFNMIMHLPQGLEDIFGVVGNLHHFPLPTHRTVFAIVIQPLAILFVRLFRSKGVAVLSSPHLLGCILDDRGLEKTQEGANAVPHF